MYGSSSSTRAVEGASLTGTRSGKETSKKRLDRAAAHGDPVALREFVKGMSKQEDGFIIVLDIDRGFSSKELDVV